MPVVGLVGTARRGSANVLAQGHTPKGPNNMRTTQGGRKHPHHLALQYTARLLLIVLALGIFASPVLASTKNWAWTMNYRYVNGKDNGVTYFFGTGGTMTFEGDVWAYSKDAGALSSPLQIKMRVYRESFPGDVLECSADRTPSSTLNVHRSFLTECGQPPADTYYIVAYTTEDDGWNTKGAGTLTMP